MELQNRNEIVPCGEDLEFVVDDLKQLTETRSDEFYVELEEEVIQLKCAPMHDLQHDENQVQIIIYRYLDFNNADVERRLHDHPLHGQQNRND
jgi:hypothetical protein